MALLFDDETADNIPPNSILKVKVESDATSINATGRVDLPNGQVNNWSHGTIFNRTKSTPLGVRGIHITRVTLAFTGKKKASATVTFSIVDAQGTVLTQWSPPPQFEGAPKDMALAKYVIDVL